MTLDPVCPALPHSNEAYEWSLPIGMAGTGGIRVKPLLAMVLAIISCCLNVILLEKMVQESPNCTVLVTLSSYVFIVLQGLVVNPQFLFRPAIPVKHYIIVSVLFFTSNLCNNVALSYEVDMPTVLIFRAGSLVANMVVSLIAFRRSYSIEQYVSVGMVTVGVLVSTAATAQLKTQTPSGAGSFTTWVIGLLMLTYGLFGSATTGVFQEKLFARFGKHPAEALFYSNLLGLVGFLPSIPNIATAVSDFNQSPHTTVLGISFLWVYCLLNVAMQNVCVRSIYYLLSEWTSLAVTLLTTLRKFLSLLLSILLFNNSFTNHHWLSTGLVFAGSALFSGLITLPQMDGLGVRLGLKSERKRDLLAA